MKKRLNTDLNYWYETAQMPDSKRKVLASAIKLFSHKDTIKRVRSKFLKMLK